MATSSQQHLRIYISIELSVLSKWLALGKMEHFNAVQHYTAGPRRFLGNTRGPLRESSTSYPTCRSVKAMSPSPWAFWMVLPGDTKTWKYREIKYAQLLWPVPGCSMAWAMWIYLVLLEPLACFSRTMPNGHSLRWDPEISRVLKGLHKADSFPHRVPR